MSAMDRTKYEIYPVGITKSGRWLIGDDPMALLTSGKDVEEDYGDALVVDARQDLLPAGAIREHFPDVDVVFPVLHGPYGEDGTIQGLFELADLPYVGAGVLGSALGLDKAVQKAVLKAHDLPIVDYIVVSRKQWRKDREGQIAEIEMHFCYPVFVKPANLGSSVGISKAHDREELCHGLDLAAEYDSKLLVEEAINAREIECSVLGNESPIASVVGEVVPSREFYDYAAKYTNGTSGLYIPADLDEGTSELIRELAVKSFVAIDCAGMARVDFFICRDTGKVYINELNTIPGFTDISMYPKLWEASGVPYPVLIDRLIDLAIERYADKQGSKTFYEPGR
jgi:D-alanine-D-alanine ligase